MTLLMLQRLTEETYSTGLHEGRLLLGYWVYLLKDLCGSVCRCCQRRDETRSKDELLGVGANLDLLIC